MHLISDPPSSQQITPHNIAPTMPMTQVLLFAQSGHDSTQFMSPIKAYCAQQQAICAAPSSHAQTQMRLSCAPLRCRTAWQIAALMSSRPAHTWQHTIQHTLWWSTHLTLFAAWTSARIPVGSAHIFHSVVRIHDCIPLHVRVVCGDRPSKVAVARKVLLNLLPNNICRIEPPRCCGSGSAAARRRWCKSSAARPCCRRRRHRHRSSRREQCLVYRWRSAQLPRQCSDLAVLLQGLKACQRCRLKGEQPLRATRTHIHLVERPTAPGHSIRSIVSVCSNTILAVVAGWSTSRFLSLSPLRECRSGSAATS